MILCPPTYPTLPVTLPPHTTHYFLSLCPPHYPTLPVTLPPNPPTTSCHSVHPPPSHHFLSLCPPQCVPLSYAVVGTIPTYCTSPITGLYTCVCMRLCYTVYKVHSLYPCLYQHCTLFNSSTVCNYPLAWYALYSLRKCVALLQKALCNFTRVVRSTEASVSSTGPVH